MKIIPSSEIKCLKSEIFTTGWGESGKVILQVSIAFFGVLSKNFRAKVAQPPRKIGPYAYESSDIISR